MMGFASWNMMWSELRSCWNASSARWSSGRLEDLGWAAAGVDQHGHLAQDRQSDPVPDLVGRDEPTPEGGRRQGGEHGRDETEGDGRHDDRLAGIRRRGRELRRAQFRQDQRGRRLAVRHVAARWSPAALA